MHSIDELRVWVATVDMGLGHQRATYPFSGIAEEGILAVNNGSFVSAEEKKLWDRLRNAYEFLSRARSLPLVRPATPPQRLPPGRSLADRARAAGAAQDDSPRRHRALESRRGDRRSLLGRTVPAGGL